MIESVLCLIRTLPQPVRRPMPDAYCYACGWEHDGSCGCTLFVRPPTVEDAVVFAQVDVNAALGLNIAATKWTPSTVAVAELLIERLERDLDLARKHSRHLAA